jgi:uncharacterized membrane protein YjjP (DUF1212 family)
MAARRDKVPPSSDEAARKPLAAAAGAPVGDRLLAQFARSLHEAGAPAQRLEGLVTACAERLGVRASIFSLPTWIHIAVDRGDGQRSVSIRVDPGSPKLALLEATYAIADRFLSGALDARSALAALERLEPGLQQPPVGALVLGYALFSAGAARFLGGGMEEMLVSFPVGALVAFSLALARGRRERELLSEFGGALVATVAAAFAVMFAGWSGHSASLPIVSLAGLVTLLPGLSLATAMSELSTRHLACGSARLIGAISTLAVVGIGAALGQAAVRRLGVVPAESLVPEAAATGALDALTATALVAFAGGLSLIFQSRASRAPVVLLACVFGWGAAQFGRATVGVQFAPFVAALLVAGAAAIYARWRREAALALLLPGLSFLLPGSIGFRGVQGVLASDTAGGIQTTVSALAVAASIAAGILVANAIFPPKRHL